MSPAPAPEERAGPQMGDRTAWRPEAGPTGREARGGARGEEAGPTEREAGPAGGRRGPREGGGACRREAGAGPGQGGRAKLPQGPQGSSRPCGPGPHPALSGPRSEGSEATPLASQHHCRVSKAPRACLAPKPVPQPLRCRIPTVAPASTEPHMQPRKKYHRSSRHVTWRKPTSFTN